MHENNVPFINDGEHVNVVEITTGLSLTVIIGVLALTVVASLLSPAGRAKTLVHGVRRHAKEYLAVAYDVGDEERAEIYARMVEEESKLDTLAPRYRDELDEDGVLYLLEKAHARHAKLSG